MRSSPRRAARTPVTILAVNVPAAASGGAKLLKLAVEGPPVSGFAGIADEAFFGVSFDDILGQT